MSVEMLLGGLPRCIRLLWYMKRFIHDSIVYSEKQINLTEHYSWIAALLFL